MSQLHALYHMQEVELSILQHNTRLKAIAAALSDNKAIRQAQAGVAAAQNKLTPLRSKVRSIELEIQGNAEKARGSEERLYGGAVKNPKELQDLQNEIQSLRKRNAELEDRLLELMLAVEEAETELSAAETRLAAVTQTVAGAHKGLIDEQARLQEQVEALRQEHEQVAAGISAEHHDLYNRLKPRKNNRPLALLDGNACAACGVEQTSTAVQQLRRTQEWIYCSSCGRILVGQR